MRHSGRALRWSWGYKKHVAHQERLRKMKFFKPWREKAEGESSHSLLLPERRFQKPLIHTLLRGGQQKSHEAMDMSCPEENPGQIQRIKSSQWEWCTLDEESECLGNLHPWRFSQLSWTGLCMACSHAWSRDGAMHIFNVTSPTTPGSLLPKLQHASLALPWPLQRQCFLMPCYTQVQPLLLLDSDTNGNLHHGPLPSLQLPQFSQSLLLGFSSRQV